MGLIKVERGIRDRTLRGGGARDGWMEGRSRERVEVLVWKVSREHDHGFGQIVLTCLIGLYL